MAIPQEESKRIAPIAVLKNKDMFIGYVIGIMARQGSAPQQPANGEKDLNEELKAKGDISIPQKEQAKQNPAFVDINCSCGAFFQFKTPEEIPVSNIVCPVCERVLIQYNFSGEENLIKVHISYLYEATRYLENIYLVLLNVIEKFPDHEYLLTLNMDIKKFLVNWRKYVLGKSL